MTRACAIASLTILGLTVSHSPAQELPLPEALTTAKTAVVVNDGVGQPVYERLVEELKAWKRLSLVEDRSRADIAILIKGENATGINGGNGQAVRAIAYRLSFKRGDTVLYSDTLKGCCSLKAMMRKTIERLDKRLRGAKER